MSRFPTFKTAFVLKDYSNELDQEKNNQPTNQVYNKARASYDLTAIHLFLGFFLKTLSHGGVAVQYHD